MSDKNKMKIPQGSEGFFFEEAYIHRKVTEALHKLFNSWGYLPVETPVFDLFDVYRSLIPEAEVDKVYRLIDRDGDLLMLRSDITLFLARQVGMIISENDLPVRICYSDSILRHQNSEDISHNEFFQSGVELVGKPGFEGDIEVLLLLGQTIKLLDIPARVHLGSHALFNSIFSGFSEKDKGVIINLTSKREFAGLADFCTPLLGREDAEKASALFGFIGEREELKAEGLFSELAGAELNHLSELMEDLEKAGVAEYFTIDLSEVGSQAYHTGIVFQVYMDAVDSAVISGGRYDSLLSKFGIDAPSVGFSLLQRKIEPGIGGKNRFSLPSDTVKVDKGSIMDSFFEAEKIRKKGGTAII
jgi:ATP phosphoribosyltransferase regulatory subunit